MNLRSKRFLGPGRGCEFTFFVHFVSFLETANHHGCRVNAKTHYTVEALCCKTLRPKFSADDNCDANRRLAQFRFDGYIACPYFKTIW